MQGVKSRSALIPSRGPFFALEETTPRQDDEDVVWVILKYFTGSGA